MCTEVRVTLILIAATLMLVTGWFATAAVSANAAVMRKWQRLEGTLVGLAAVESMEVELGREPDTRRVRATADHMVGLGFLNPVTVYADPADPERFRLGGFLQFWLWPATMLGLAAVFCLIMLGLTWLGGSSAAREDRTVFGWHFSPPPEFAQTAIVVRAPASEMKAPLFWSLLGLVALGFGVFAPGASSFTRLPPLLAGGLFITVTWLLALNNYTLRISADNYGLRSTSALRWREVKWDEVKSVERRELYSAQRKAFGRESLPFPGSTTESIVFAGAGGRSLLRMSTRMQPREAVRRLFETCEARTGLTEQFRRIRVPEI